MKFKYLLYCTKGKPYLNCDYGIDSPEDYKGNWHIYTANNEKECTKIVNGTIIGGCDIDLVEEIYYLSWMNENLRERILKQSCLTDKQFNDYMNGKDTCYALHLSNVKVFEEPMELSEFSTLEYVGKEGDFKSYYINDLKRAPQNMCRVYDSEGNCYILISIKPQWLCKILNGEKKIEVRKQILNCMKELIK